MCAPKPYQLLTKNVRHFVLEVLGSHQRIEKLAATLYHGVNLTTASTEMRIIVERLPKVVDGLATGFGTGIDQDAYLGLNEC